MCLISAAFSGNKADILFVGSRGVWLWSGEEIITNTETPRWPSSVAAAFSYTGKSTKHRTVLVSTRLRALCQQAAGEKRELAKIWTSRCPTEWPHLERNLVISMSWEKERALNQACVGVKGNWKSASLVKLSTDRQFRLVLCLNRQ